MQPFKEEKLTLNIQTEASFEALFHSYYEMLTRYAFTFINNSDEAEDIVQQVYINLWENRMKVQVHTSARSLLYKAVYNACLNRIKHLKIKTRYNSEALYTTEQSYTHPTDQKELMNRLDEALKALPEQCRRIFEMSRFEQLKYHEIAEKLNLSIKTIENQMGKALKIMRMELKDYLPIILMILSKIHNG